MQSVVEGKQYRTLDIDWHQYHAEQQGDANLKDTEQKAEQQLDSASRRLDGFYKTMHESIVEHDRRENQKSAENVQEVREMRQKQHEHEVEQKRIENEKTIAQLLQEGSSSTSSNNENNNGSGSTTTTMLLSMNNKPAAFAVSRADELREKEMSVTKRRTNLFDLRNASNKAATDAIDAMNNNNTSSSTSINKMKENESAIITPNNNNKNLTSSCSSSTTTPSSNDLDIHEDDSPETIISKIQAQEKTSVALFELKKQARMRLEEDRLRRAADRIAAETEGRASEQEHKYRRIIERVEKQRKVYETKHSAMSDLVNEGQRLRGIKDRASLLELKQKLLSEVEEIDSFLEQTEKIL